MYGILDTAILDNALRNSINPLGLLSIIGLKGALLLNALALSASCWRKEPLSAPLNSSCGDTIVV